MQKRAHTHTHAFQHNSLHEKLFRFHFQFGIFSFSVRLFFLSFFWLMEKLSIENRIFLKKVSICYKTYFSECGGVVAGAGEVVQIIQNTFTFNPSKKDTSASSWDTTQAKYFQGKILFKCVDLNWASRTCLWRGGGGREGWY